MDKIESGGVLIYNHSDPVLKELVERHPSSVRKIPYGIPTHRIENGITVVTLDGHSGVLKVFGEHNLLNLQAAFLACKELGIAPAAFLKGITGFGGAAKRLELLAGNQRLNIYRDFAHAPSKVRATMEAVKRQFPDRNLIAVLELHTFSSLNEQFLSEYHGALDLADEAVVFYSRHALELKRLPPLSPEKVAAGFGKKDLLVLNEKEDLLKWLMEQSYENVNLLLMSSGNYDGLDIVSFANKVTQQGL
jgi:UDP-N-acetylmuramate: L-alanyl-gamma-D-glutamyl-meso-diaminopimelate ligase